MDMIITFVEDSDVTTEPLSIHLVKDLSFDQKAQILSKIIDISLYNEESSMQQVYPIKDLLYPSENL